MLDKYSTTKFTAPDIHYSISLHTYYNLSTQTKYSVHKTNEVFKMITYKLFEIFRSFETLNILAS